MSVYVCLTCFNEYSDMYNMMALSTNIEWIQLERPCLINQCDGEVVEIDELLAPAIIELNQKGYITKYCCSGHTYKSEAFSFYVSFNDGEYFTIPREVFGSLPVGFNIQAGVDNIVIRYSITHHGQRGSIELMEEVFNVNRQFLEWVRTLDVLDEE